MFDKVRYNREYRLVHIETINEYNREYKLTHKELFRDYANKRRRKMAEFLLQQKESGCVVCGERDPVVLEFHHIDPTQKEHDVASMLGMSMNTVKKELKKCVVLCANDHIRVQKGVVELPKGKR